MPPTDRFKSFFLALVVLMIGLKYLIVAAVLGARVVALELHPLAELRIIVPTAALLLGAAQAARGELLRPGGSHGLRLALAVLGLGVPLAIIDDRGFAALLDPIAAITADPRAVVVPAALWALQAVAAWLFGGWVVGVLFFPRPGLDHE